jgi:hypothetical protein
VAANRSATAIPKDAAILESYARCSMCVKCANQSCRNLLGASQRGQCFIHCHEVSSCRGREAGKVTARNCFRVTGDRARRKGLSTPRGSTTSSTRGSDVQLSYSRRASLTATALSPITARFVRSRRKPIVLSRRQGRFDRDEQGTGGGGARSGASQNHSGSSGRQGDLASSAGANVFVRSANRTRGGFLAPPFSTHRPSVRNAGQSAPMSQFANPQREARTRHRSN